MATYTDFIDNVDSSDSALNNLIPMHRLLVRHASSPATWNNNMEFTRQALKHSYQMTLDRVNELGKEDLSYGHTGCVNALSWAFNGDVLVSGGDDKTVRLWRLDNSDTSTPYPYKCDAVLNTGHRANIFNAQFLPQTSKIATVAGDKEVRILDAERALATTSQGKEEPFRTRDICSKVLRCHSGRTKRIVTEESSDVFLTVAEDGTVRQHDLREPHTCSEDSCPKPLVKFPHDLSTLSLSPVTPYHFVVGGESPYGYLLDRRHSGRVLQEEWGIPPNKADLVTCVRRFSRRQRGVGERRGFEHITGCRISRINGHEVVLTYSGDAAYLFSTRDDTVSSSEASAMLDHNPVEERRSENHRDNTSSGDEDEDEDMLDEGDEEDEDEYPLTCSFERTPDSENTIQGKFETEVILPRQKYAGACNVDTVKDVNFIGPYDELIVSGSDDGNFFVWDKTSGKVCGIYEGDGSVVNVIEDHPRLPIIAVSGIDTTVKLFAPSTGPSSKSKMDKMEDIVAHNLRTSRTTSRGMVNISSLLMRHGFTLQSFSEHANGEEGPSTQCTYQ